MRLLSPANKTSELLANEKRELQRLAGLMIPAHVGYGVPGADDASIFDAIVTSAESRIQEVRHALAHLETLTEVPLCELNGQRQLEVVRLFGERAPASAAALVSLVAACYYRDERVMRALGMEVRAPFPKGFPVEKGDWSLLEPVRAGPRRYRAVD